MNAWDDDECDTYVGTDSTIFPALMTKEEGAFPKFEFNEYIVILLRSLCRNLGI